MTDVALPSPTSVPHLFATDLTSSASRATPKTADLAHAISEIEMRTQIHGASFLTVTLIDPDWAIHTAGWLNVDSEGLLDTVEVNFPSGSNSWWRLCTVEPTLTLNGPNLTLTFEDRIVAYLRDHWGPKHVKHGTTTRAQFVQQLVDEVGRGGKIDRIRFVCPELNVVQPVAVQSTVTTIVQTPAGKATVTKPDKSRGIHPQAAILIKGQPATAQQIHDLNYSLSSAHDFQAPQLAVEAMLCAGIGESNFDRHASNGKYKGIWQSDQVAPDSVAEMAYYFLAGGKGFQGGGAVKLSRTVSDPGAIAYMVEGDLSNFGGDTQKAAEFYSKWLPEAKAIIAAYGSGFDNGDLHLPGIDPTPVRSDVDQLQRGTTDNPDEDSWDCIQRLAGDVNWFAFSNADTLYYMDGPDLAGQTPALYLDLKDPDARAMIVSLSGTVDNSSFEYRTTRKVKGKVKRQSRIVKPSSPSEVRLTLICEPDAYRAGDVIVLRNAGSLNGRWIVSDATRRWLGDVSTSFTLAPPTAPIPEPQYDTSLGDGSQGGPGSSNPVAPAGSPVSVSTTTADYPLAEQGTLIGTPYQGTHAKAFNIAGGSDNWESENAVDIGVPIGTKVFAVDDGTIGPEIGSLGTGGRFAGLRLHLVTKTNEWYYAHLSKIVVKAGDKVTAGQLLGYSGQANGVAHLHIASEHGNPEDLLGFSSPTLVGKHHPAP